VLVVVQLHIMFSNIVAVLVWFLAVLDVTDLVKNIQWVD